MKRFIELKLAVNKLEVDYTSCVRRTKIRVVVTGWKFTFFSCINVPREAILKVYVSSFPPKGPNFQCVYPLLLISCFRMAFRILAIAFKLQAVGKNETTFMH